MFWTTETKNGEKHPKCTEGDENQKKSENGGVRGAKPRKESVRSAKLVILKASYQGVLRRNKIREVRKGLWETEERKKKGGT